MPRRPIIRRALAALPQQLVVSTHDLELAGEMERVIWIDHGQIVADGEPGAVIAQYSREMAA